MRRILVLGFVLTMSGAAVVANVSVASAAPLSVGCDLFNNPIVDGTYNNLGVSSLPFFRGETIILTAGPPFTFPLPALPSTSISFNGTTIPLQAAPIPGSGVAVITYSFPADTTTDTEWRLVGGLLTNTAVWDVSCTALALSTQASSSSVTATSSATITDTATLAGGVNPTGTLTFSLFGPDNATCGGTPVFTDTEAVAGNGAYTSDPFTTAAQGAYRWVVTYGGDANNLAATSPCNAPNETSLVNSVCDTVPPAGTLPGNTIVVAQPGLLTTGTSGDDVIYGTPGDDRIDGAGGNDVIFGAGGNDRLTGGANNDTVCGGDGNDALVGSGGDDLLSGDTGNDDLAGGTGNDRLLGGPGVNRLSGGDGLDTCNRGPELASQAATCESVA